LKVTLQGMRAMKTFLQPTDLIFAFTDRDYRAIMKKDSPDRLFFYELFNELNVKLNAEKKIPTHFTILEDDDFTGKIPQSKYIVDLDILEKHGQFNEIKESAYAFKMIVIVPPDTPESKYKELYRNNFAGVIHTGMNKNTIVDKIMKAELYELYNAALLPLKEATHEFEFQRGYTLSDALVIDINQEHMKPIDYGLAHKRKLVYVDSLEKAVKSIESRNDKIDQKYGLIFVNDVLTDTMDYKHSIATIKEKCNQIRKDTITIIGTVDDISGEKIRNLKSRVDGILVKHYTAADISRLISRLPLKEIRKYVN